MTRVVAMRADVQQAVGGLARNQFPSVLRHQPGDRREHRQQLVHQLTGALNEDGRIAFAPAFRPECAPATSMRSSGVHRTRRCGSRVSRKVVSRRRLLAHRGRHRLSQHEIRSRAVLKCRRSCRNSSVGGAGRDDDGGCADGTALGDDFDVPARDLDLPHARALEDHCSASMRPPPRAPGTRDRDRDMNASRMRIAAGASGTVSLPSSLRVSHVPSTPAFDRASNSRRSFFSSSRAATMSGMTGSSPHLMFSRRRSAAPSSDARRQPSNATRAARRPCACSMSRNAGPGSGSSSPALRPALPCPTRSASMTIALMPATAQA